MRFFIDECLMPTLAEIAIEYGYEATSVRDLINHVIEVNYDGISTEITLYQAPTLG